MAEFAAEARGGPDDRSMVGHEIRGFAASWQTPAGFHAYLTDLIGQARPDWPRPAGHVPATNLWWTDGDQYLGRLAIRHELTPTLREIGGHIGYDVRPTARRRGHATAMLAAALPIARRLGIDLALITCDATNTASRTVIERNGGMLENELRGKLRYWVPTASEPSSFTTVRQ